MNIMRRLNALEQAVKPLPKRCPTCAWDRDKRITRDQLVATMDDPSQSQEDRDEDRFWVELVDRYGSCPTCGNAIHLRAMSDEDLDRIEEFLKLNQ